MVHTSLAFMPWKDHKETAADIKTRQQATEF